ncbi:neural cell adhesion molecule 1-like isoform X8 [Antedon mediterranea]|uniref:neural cell adhesion molecule 1-like isoform X8 n=1 Tax=Antedon mediterranea TaxID=105859 RepID=UPI003AF9E388
MDSLRILLFALAYVRLSYGAVSLAPQGPTLEKGMTEDIVILCTYSGGDDLRPQWRDPQNNVVPLAGTGVSGGVAVTHPTTTITKLEITNPQESHEGQYTCFTTDGEQKSINLVLYPPLELEADSPQSFEIYRNARVLCKVNSKANVLYEWKFGELAIAGTNAKYNIEHKEYLEIVNISSQDDGTYECSATETTGLVASDSIDIRVEVLVPPKITLGPEDFNGTEGKNAEFKCIATGNPPPVLRWTTSGNQVIESTDRFTIEDSGEKLIINDLRKADEGSYICTATVEKLTITAQRVATLRVFIPPVVQEGIEKSALENSRETLSCNTVSGDKSELTWRRFGEDMPVGVQPTAADIEVQSLQDGSRLDLIFSSVKRSYNGSYECFAKNAGGEASAISNLTVNFPPVIDKKRQDQQGAYTGWIGNEMTLTCYWLANPPAQYYWVIKRNTQVTNLTDISDPVFTVFSTADGASSVSFTPGKSEDFSVYTCYAYNVIDVVEQVAQHNIDFRSAGAPDAPNVEVDTNRPTSITLRIEEPEYTGGLDIISYNITWKFESRGEEVVKYEVFDYKNEDDEDFERYVIEGLDSEKPYKIQVAAKNEYILGEQSEEVIGRTLSSRPPYAPKITSPQTSESETEYTLEWEEPADNGGAEIEAYYIQYWEYDPNRPNEVIENGDKSSVQKVDKEYRKHIIAELEKATDYKVEIWASSTLGDGNRDIIAFKTAGKKNLPTAGEFSTSTSTTKQNSTPSPLQRQTTPASDDGDTTVKPAESVGLEKGTIIGIVIAAFLIVLIVVDISCCIVNDCGMTMCLCVHCCGRQAPGTKATEVELGEEKENGTGKKTLVDETNSPGKSTNQQANSCDVTVNGGEAGKGKVAYSEIREDGDGSAPSDPPVEKDKLIGSNQEPAE